MLDRAKVLAERVQRETDSDTAFIERAFRLTFSREPSESERKIAREFLTKQEKITGTKDAAVTDLCHMLLNSNEFVYIN